MRRDTSVATCRMDRGRDHPGELLPGCSQRSLDIQVEQKPVCAVGRRQVRCDRIRTMFRARPLVLVGSSSFSTAGWALAYGSGNWRCWLVAENVLGARFAPSGILGLATSQKSSRGLGLPCEGLNGEPEFRTPTSGQPTFGVARAGMSHRAFVCDEGGIRIFDHLASTGPLYQAADADCQWLLPSTSGSRLVYSAKNDRLHAVGLESLEAQAIDDPSWGAPQSALRRRKISLPSHVTERCCSTAGIGPSRAATRIAVSKPS